MEKNEIFLYMSLWGEHGGAPGLGLFSFDTETGSIRLIRKLDDSRSFGPSVIDREKNLFYVCNETNLEPELGYDSGRIYGFSIDPETGSLTERFRQETYCPFPDYIGFSADRQYMLVPHHSQARSITSIERDDTGRYVPVVRYMDSAIDLFAMNADGTVKELVDVRKHAFTQKTTDYQNKVTIPHPHCAVRSPSGKLFAICDKGDCHLYLYTIDREAGKLKLLSKMMTDVPLSEPRYCVFHPTLPYLYVNHEHSATGRMMVTALRYDEEGGVSIINRVDCLPQGERADCGQGLCISADGRYIYNQLSGYNCVAVLEVNPADGSIQLKQRAMIEGAKPRNCCLSPDGRFLVTACLTGEIAVYAVGTDGCLTLTPHSEFLPGSAYITFYQPN